MAAIELKDNSREVLAALKAAEAEALEVVGGIWETRAKALAPTKWGAELRNSISHTVQDGVLSVGSEMEIAAYAELGTGKEYDPPPEWLENNVPKGTKALVKQDKAGVDYWLYYDPLKDEFRIGRPQAASPYLRPALENNKAEYKRIMEDALRNAGGT